MIRTAFVTAALFLAFAAPASAQKYDEAPLVLDHARPAVGDWLGSVSWNSPLVQYAWTLRPDGTFTSGRAGRGENGGGEWGTRGAHLTLKYDNRVRYEGDLKGDDYSGTAYAADGRELGGFSMSRVDKVVGQPDDEQQ